MKRGLLYFRNTLSALIAIFLLTACHISKKASSDIHKSARDEVATSISDSRHEKKVSAERKKIAEEARTWLGTPYAYSHSEKGVATDCSGMVLKVYETVAGIKLPRNSAQQAEFCRQIKRKQIQTGDLVFFATGRDPDKISHVGIMLDDENFIHASASKGVVVSSIDTPYYIRTFKGFGRVTD